MKSAIFPGAIVKGGNQMVYYKKSAAGRRGEK